MIRRFQLNLREEYYTDHYRHHPHLMLSKHETTCAVGSLFDETVSLPIFLPMTSVVLFSLQLSLATTTSDVNLRSPSSSPPSRLSFLPLMHLWYIPPATITKLLGFCLRNELAPSVLIFSCSESVCLHKCHCENQIISRHLNFSIFFFITSFRN